MHNSFEQFKEDVSQVVGDTALQQKIRAAKKQYLIGFEEAITQFSNLETAKRRAVFSRWKALENLDNYLIEFEANFIKAGGKVIWAQDAAEACNEIMAIMNKSGESKIVKSKTLTAEEIHLDEALLAGNIQWTETDLGQFILQLAGEKPSHMVMPAIHKSKEDIQQLFQEKLGVKVQNDAEALAAEAAKVVRSKYVKPGIGITGANFLVADQGIVAITENEGNVMLAAARPRIHIVITGIDRVVPTVNDLHVLWPMLATYGTGQKITAYNSLLKGPRRNGEVDGPDEMYVVLIDNGRSKVMAEELQRNVLTCIRCGSCLYNDPVYSIIGAQPYRSTWMGPPGNIVIPIKEGMKTHGFHNHLSTLSAADTEWCPVNINFNKLLLNNRQKAVDDQSSGTSEKLFYFLWKQAMLKREIMNWKSIRPASFFMSNIFTKSPLGLRKMKTPAKESFNALWRKRMGGG
ncbi:MAG: lactate utilization protein [Bacteroidetes bacterium]|nr:lactate utilization protein [Bacteroidota bacterium]